MLEADRAPHPGWLGAFVRHPTAHPEAARGRERVRLHIERIPADEVQLHFKAADLVVLPYRRTVNSGASFLALFFERPVLVPDLGNMAEHARTFGSDWIGLHEDELTSGTLADAVRRAWRDVLERLGDWRAMNTTDGLWNTRLWVRPGQRAREPGRASRCFGRRERVSDPVL